MKDWEFDPFYGIEFPSDASFIGDTQAYNESGIILRINPFFIQLVIGALEGLTNPHTWDGTNEDVQAAIKQIRQLQDWIARWETAQSYLEANLREHTMKIGDFVPSMSLVADEEVSGRLLCDGRFITETDYPELVAFAQDANDNYAAGWTLDTVDDEFGLYLPQLVLGRKGLVGSSPNYEAGRPAGVEGGAMTHTLDISEIPSHSHSYSIYAITPLVGSTPGTAAMGGTGSPTYYGSTGAQGGGQPHNNMPPWLGVFWYVISKTSSFIGAKGEKGDDGLQGIPGTPGQRGEQGLQGIPGNCGCLGTPPMPPIESIGDLSPETWCAVAQGLADWLNDKFGDVLNEIQAGIQAAQTIRNIVGNIIGVIPIFGDAIDLVLDMANDIAEKDINHMKAIIEDNDWKETVLCKLYCHLLPLVPPVDEATLADALSDVADEMTLTDPWGSFITFVGTAFSFYMRSISMREYMMRAALYADDGSNNCVICACDQKCTEWLFTQDNYEWQLVSGRWAEGTGFRPLTESFGLAAIEFTFPTPVVLTYFEVEFYVVSSTPGTTLYAEFGGEADSRQNPGNGTKTLSWSGLLMNCTAANIFCDGFAGLSIRRAKIYYVASDIIEPGC